MFQLEYYRYFLGTSSNVSAVQYKIIQFWYPMNTLEFLTFTKKNPMKKKLTWYIRWINFFTIYEVLKAKINEPVVF